MGLGIEFSGLESNSASEMATNHSESFTNSAETTIGNNGTSIPEAEGNENEVLEAVNSPPLVIPKASSPSPSPETIKGKGLRRWKRIKRDGVLDGGSNLENNKLLKRGSSNFSANLNKPVKFSAERKQTSEGSASSSNAMWKSFGVSVDHCGENADSGLVVGPSLVAGTDLENSEDHSSKSTAASAPKIRHEIREKNKMKSLSGKNLENSLHKGHQGKPRTYTSKKQKGEQVKIEKENSHSSMESDSRTSHFVYGQGNHSATSNGRQSGKSMISVGEISDEAHGVEQELSEEPQAGSSRKIGEFEVTSSENFEADTSWAAKDDKSENNGSFRELDPLVESIMLLHSVQQDLGKEVEKFRDVGKEDFIQEYLSEQLESGEVVEESFDVVGLDVLSLKETVDSLRIKLDNAAALLEVKETRIDELEGILRSKLPKGEIVEPDQEKYGDLELELESLFKQKIEAEVEYLAMAKTVQNLRVAVSDQIKILEDQKSKQANLLEKLEDAGQKDATLKGRSENLEFFNEDIASIGETLKLRNSMWKHASCFLLQLVLFAIILAVFFGQLVPYQSDFVPT